MFTSQDRERLRAELLAAAAEDPRLSGGAITGSASVGKEDRWSDIDLGFGVSDPAQIPAVLADWSARMYDRHGATHHVDVTSGAWIYRVFLLRSTLQVDLAFAPATDFGARAPTFKLVFGKAATLSHVVPQSAESLIGYAWLYSLHVRSAIVRGKLWQAEYMLGNVRDHVLALACVRFGLPAREGRGTDQLPAEVTKPLERSLVARLDPAELQRAFGVAVDALTSEARQVDSGVIERVGPVLEELVETSRTRLVP